MKRPIKEQVNNGVRVGLGFGSFLIGAMLFIAGMDRLMWSAVPPHSISWSDPIGWAELILALAMLIPSAGIWWQLLAGFMLFAIVKGALVLITGTDLYTQSGSFPAHGSGRTCSVRHSVTPADVPVFQVPTDDHR